MENTEKKDEEATENPNEHAPDAPTMKAHPAADVFPMLGERELAELAEDIKAHGQRERIVIHDGEILDGRNRYAACNRAGVTPQFEEWGGEGGTPYEFVVSRNIHRRQLNATQRAMVAAKLVPQFKVGALRRMRAGKAADPSAETRGGKKAKASEEAALLLNVSPRSVECALKIVRTGVPDLVAAVESGAIKVSLAQHLTKLSKKKLEALAKKPKELRAEAKGLARVAEELEPTESGVHEAPEPGDVIALVERAVANACDALAGDLAKLGELRVKLEQHAAEIARQQEEQAARDGGAQ